MRIKYQTCTDRIVKCATCTHHPASIYGWTYLPTHCFPPPSDYFEVNPKYRIISSVNISGCLSKEKELLAIAFEGKKNCRRSLLLQGLGGHSKIWSFIIKSTKVFWAI